MPEIGTYGLMSEDGKQGDAGWPKPLRPSSTLRLVFVPFIRPDRNRDLALPVIPDDARGNVHGGALLSVLNKHRNPPPRGLPCQAHPRLAGISLTAATLARKCTNRGARYGQRRCGNCCQGFCRDQPPAAAMHGGAVRARDACPLQSARRTLQRGQHHRAPGGPCHCRTRRRRPAQCGAGPFCGQSGPAACSSPDVRARAGVPSRHRPPPSTSAPTPETRSPRRLRLASVRNGSARAR